MEATESGRVVTPSREPFVVDKARVGSVPDNSCVDIVDMIKNNIILLVKISP